MKKDVLGLKVCVHANETFQGPDGRPGYTIFQAYEGEDPTKAPDGFVLVEHISVLVPRPEKGPEFTRLALASVEERLRRANEDHERATRHLREQLAKLGKGEA